jgi:hypothetical protein
MVFVALLKNARGGFQGLLQITRGWSLWDLSLLFKAAAAPFFFYTCFPVQQIKTLRVLSDYVVCFRISQYKWGLPSLFVKTFEFFFTLCWPCTITDGWANNNCSWFSPTFTDMNNKNGTQWLYCTPFHFFFGGGEGQWYLCRVLFRIIEFQLQCWLSVLKQSTSWTTYIGPDLHT